MPALLLLAVAVGTAHCMPEIEIQFEPMPMDPMIENMLRGSTSKHHAESKLDHELERLFAGLGRHQPNGPIGHPVGQQPNGPHSHRGFHAFASSPMIEMAEPSLFKDASGKSAFPAAMFRDLFPGPLEMGTHAHGKHPMPFSEPDPLVSNLVQDLDKAFLGLMHNVHSAATADRTPNSCAEDLKTHCQGTRSKLHCLGQHAESISEGCHKDIGKSVPFRCHRFIDRFCNVMETGILSCLGNHMSELSNQCRDSVLATHHIISKANTQRAAIVDTSTGVKQVTTPSDTVTAPPSLVGAPPTEATPHQLPQNVMDLLGTAKSVRGGDSAFSLHHVLKAMVLVAIIVAMCLTPSVGSWHIKKCRALLGIKNKEDDCLLSGTVTLELPKAVDGFVVA